MSNDLLEFEQKMHREITDFLNSDIKRPSPSSRKATKSRPKTAPQSTEAMQTGHVVKLAVRTKQLEMDTVFEHRSSSISKLEAQMEAEKAAKAAGYPIIGFVIDITRF